MNYDTVETHGKNNGTPFARSVWDDAEGKPTKWLIFERGALFLYSETERRMLRYDDLTEADYRALDWRFPDAYEGGAIPRPNIGGESQATTPTFDIESPPINPF